MQLRLTQSVGQPVQRLLGGISVPLCVFNQVGGNVTSLNVTGLTPNTNYSFSIDVCTVAGCVTSADSHPVLTETAGKSNSR